MSNLPCYKGVLLLPDVPLSPRAVLLSRSLHSGCVLFLVLSRGLPLAFCRSLRSRLFLRGFLFRALPGLGCVGFSMPFQPAETSGGHLVSLCPRQHFCILVILCFTNGESKTVTPRNPSRNGWSYTGHVTWSLACRYIRSRTVLHCAPLHMSIPYKGRRGHRLGRWAPIAPR